MSDLQHKIKLLEADIYNTRAFLSLNRKLLWKDVSTPPVLYGIIGGGFLLAFIWGRSKANKEGPSLATRISQSSTASFFLKFLPQIIQIIFPLLVA